MLALVHAAAGVANFLLNLSIVVAPFGTAEFNAQVATANAVTRVALGIPEVLAIWLVFHALCSRFPSVSGEGDFWELIGQREARHQAQSEGEEVPGGVQATAPGRPE